MLTKDLVALRNRLPRLNIQAYGGSLAAGEGTDVVTIPEEMRAMGYTIERVNYGYLNDTEVTVSVRYSLPGDLTRRTEDLVEALIKTGFDVGIACRNPMRVVLTTSSHWRKAWQDIVIRACERRSLAVVDYWVFSTKVESSFTLELEVLEDDNHSDRT